MEESWDFYFCRVDDAPASIFLDLDLISSIKDAKETTLYAVRIEMTDLGDHGMGSAEEAGMLGELEDRITRDVGEHGLRFIGRVRNNGVWQLNFMGPEQREALCETLLRSCLPAAGRAFELVTKPDEDWSYYREFLYPSAERMQWMQDRKVVEALQREGDLLDQPRRVDHWMSFTDEPSRAAVSEEAAALGFEAIIPERDEDSEWPLQLHRVDPVTLEDIHEVVIELTELAEAHGGEYTGWETSVERAS